MTSGNTLPNRPTRIDKLTLPDHPHLTQGDECYFFGEYTARGGYAYSHTNNLISNFKKGMDRRNRFEWRYKLSAIQEVATAFRTALPDWFGPDLIPSLTFVPVPPSKDKRRSPSRRPYGEDTDRDRFDPTSGRPGGYRPNG